VPELFLTASVELVDYSWSMCSAGYISAVAPLCFTSFFGARQNVSILSGVLNPLWYLKRLGALLSTLHEKGIPVEVASAINLAPLLLYGVSYNYHGDRDFAVGFNGLGLPQFCTVDEFYDYFELACAVVFFLGFEA
jgi:hypothetical protein